MTIKPAAIRAPPDTDGNLENPDGGGATGDPNNHGQHAQSPQRRELYEDLSRHRCSPNKSRSKRRDHIHEHHKRERNDWNKHNESVSNAASASPRSLGVGQMLLNNAAGVGLSLSPSKNVSGTAVVGRNSPAMNDVTSAAATNHLLAAAAAATGVGNANVVVGNSSAVGVGGVVASHSPSRDHNHHHHHGVTTSTTPSPSTTATAAAGMLQGTITSNVLKSIEESCSGYNSGDEHMPTKQKTVSEDEWKHRDEQFVRIMSEAGFEVRQVEDDGACLFRSISLQIYGDEDAHDIVRQHTMDYIFKNRDYFSQFVTEDINSYITRKRRKDSHGNHIEIQAMSEIYARPVEVYCYKSKPINIFNSEQQRNGYAPLRLSYQRMSHYNAIIDPYNATVGVGLGLANYHPKMQTEDAMLMSEQLQIEQTMFEDKLKTTDWEATNEVIEEQVARESYLQWCRENLQKSRTAAVRSATSTVTSAQASSSDIATSPTDEIASPSKQHARESSGGSDGAKSPAIKEVVGDCGNGITNAVGIGVGSPAMLSASLSAGNVVSTSSPSPTTVAKKLNAKVKMQKDANLMAATSASGYDSDDTDISTNNTIADGGGIGGGGESPQQAIQRSKKLKTRYFSKKRRHEQLIRHGDIADADDSADGSPHQLSVLCGDGGNGSGSNSGSGSGSDATPRVHKGAKRDNVGVEKLANETKLEERPCSSKCVQQPTAALTVGLLSSSASDNAATNKQMSSGGVAPLSTFYQDLLESSYNGVGQLTEAEMLQRAIQLSTQDYIEHQKRKYLFRP